MGSLKKAKTKSKSLEDYIPAKGKKVPVPARIWESTVERAQAAAKRRDVTLTDFIDGAINMACDAK